MFHVLDSSLCSLVKMFYLWEAVTLIPQTLKLQFLQTPQSIYGNDEEKGHSYFYFFGSQIHVF